MSLCALVFQLLAEREAFLKTEQKNNIEVEMKINSHERTIARKREVTIRRT